MSSARVTYTPRPESNPTTELDALTAVYRYVLDCAGTRDRTPNSGPDDAKEIKSVRAKTILHQDP